MKYTKGKVIKGLFGNWNPPIQRGLIDHKDFQWFDRLITKLSKVGYGDTCTGQG